MDDEPFGINMNGHHENVDVQISSTDFPSARPTGLEPCNVCGRTFYPESLARHVPICEKNLTKGSRKVFNTSRQRLSELDISQVPQGSPAHSKRGKENTSPGINLEAPKWKVQHDELLENIRYAREVSKLVAEGKPVPPPQKKDAPPGHVKCEYCLRHFSQGAAERHIDFCKEQKNRLIQPQVDTQAKERLMARTKYKAPKLKAPGTPARAPGRIGVLKPPTATPGIVANQQCHSAGSSPVTFRKTREEKSNGSSVRRRHHTLSPLTASRRSDLTPRYFDDDSDDDELTSDKSWGGAQRGATTDGASGAGRSRLKNASSDKGLDKATPERRKPEEEEAKASSPTEANVNRNNRKSYPAANKMAPRRKRSSTRIGATTQRNQPTKPQRDVSPAGSASSANSGSGSFCVGGRSPNNIPPPLVQLGTGNANSHWKSLPGVVIHLLNTCTSIRHVSRKSDLQGFQPSTICTTKIAYRKMSLVALPIIKFRK